MPHELDLPPGVTKEAVDALIQLNAVGIPCTASDKKAIDNILADASRQIRALPEKHLPKLEEGVGNQEPQDLPLSAMGLRVTENQKQAIDELLIGHPRLSKRAFRAEKQQENAKRPRLHETPAEDPDTVRTTPAKPPRMIIAPLRRPTKTDAWYSRMTSTEAAWAHVKPARKRAIPYWLHRRNRCRNACFSAVLQVCSLLKTTQFYDWQS